MINTILIAGIIIECIVLALMALLKKWSAKVFAVIAAITAICCLVVGVLNLGAKKTEETTDIRSTVYMAARLIEEEHAAESLELLSGVEEKEIEQYGGKSVHALAYNLSGAFMAAEDLLIDGENSESEQELLNMSQHRSTVGEELQSAITQNALSLVAATEQEVAGWETEMKVRFMGLQLTDEEKAVEKDKLTLVKDAMSDYRTEEAFKIMSENTSGMKDAIIVSEMYSRGFSNIIMAETDEEYAQLWKEATELQAELNVASLSRSNDNKIVVEDEEEDPEEEEYQKLRARYSLAQAALNEETTKRSINYLKASGEGEENTPGYQLQMAQMYFDINQHEEARKCLEKAFFNDEITSEQWLGSDIAAFKKAFIIFLSDSTDQEYSVLYDNIMNSLYQGLFANAGAGSFKEFVMAYMKEKMAGLTIMRVDTEGFPKVTANISALDKERVLDQSTLSVTDNGKEITNFTLEQIEVSDLSLVFVLDKSGSMSGSNIEQSKEAIKNCISQIESGVTMGLVSFESEASVECSLTTNGSAVRSAVDTIEATGGTDISTGIAAGLELLGNRGGTKVIILLSDGYGSGDLDSVLSEAVSKGVIIYTIGLQGSDEGTLQNISASTGGQFIMVEDTAQLSATYSDIQSAMTNSYTLTYEVDDEEEYRKIFIKEKDTGLEAAKFYSTVKDEVETETEEKQEKQNDSQFADFYKQLGGSEGGR